MINQKGFVHLDMTSFIVFCVIIGILIGIITTIGLPVFWEFIKPFIHAWTA